MQNLTIEGFRLSPQQKQLWSLQQTGGTYIAQCTILLIGHLQPEILKSALQKVVNRHENYRTIFHKTPGIKTPIQVIYENSKLFWNNIDISSYNSEKKLAIIEQIVQQEKSFNFDFEQPSLRAVLFTQERDSHTLLITLPSLCADSWTLKNLVREMSDRYADCLENKDVTSEPIQYIQFSEWQNELLEEEDAETGKNYWHQQQTEIPSLTLPFESERSDSNIINIWDGKISDDIAAKISAIAVQKNIAVADFILACWQTLLHRTQQSEIIISTVFSGRNYEELHELMGLIAKSLPLRSCFQESVRFSEFLEQTSEQLCNHEKWQEYYCQDNTLEPISFQFEDFSEKYLAGGVSFTVDKHYVCFDRFKLKLSCVRTAEALNVEFHYNPELISTENIEYIAEQFFTLVESAANNPETKVSELEIIKGSAYQQLIFDFNNTQRDIPTDKCIHQLFEAQVEQTPNNIAVVFEDEQLTYAQLNHKANQIARYLQNLGVGAEVVVGLCVERSLQSIVGLLGILKAGGAYLPIDPALPHDAIAHRLQDAQVSILLTQQQLTQTLPQSPAQIICLDDDAIASLTSDNLNSQVSTENLIYVIYTSGSTGKPKGVAVEHRQLLNYLYGIQEQLQLPSASSFATVSTFAADLGNTVIFSSLSTGGCLHIIDAQRASDPAALADYFRRHPIDCLKIVPSHLETLLTSDASTSAILPRKLLVLGGEALSWKLVEKIRDRAPNCRILNHYGPTEATVGVLTYPVTGDRDRSKSATVPLGRPIANTQIYLLDNRLQPVPIGVRGELYIAGSSLARGYINRPELTAERFIPNPFTGNGEIGRWGDREMGRVGDTSHKSGVTTHKSQERRKKSVVGIPPHLPVTPSLYKTGDKARYLPDGNIEYLGRIDQQVKIRGYRIELGEIEAILRQHPEIREAQVLAWDENANKRLVAYVVPINPTEIQNLKSNELRSFLKKKLPEYAIPSTFVTLKVMPLTANGKIDRQALLLSEPPPNSEASFVAARTPNEEMLTKIWAEVLSLEKVGVEDNFFDLGGHSLLMTQLLVKVRETFQVDLSLKSLYEAPTIAALAKNIEIGSSTNSDLETVDFKADAILDPKISAGNLPIKHQTKLDCILLTGATGFLGAFLLYELLQQTQADIYCLVRAANSAEGKARIQSSLESYLLWDDSFSDRLIPVIGDLSQPLLGLSEGQFQQLAASLDSIYHNGATVNFTLPYSALKAANVLGTQELLRLASLVKIKPVHFISTIGVVSSADSMLVQEQDNLDRTGTISSGYTQSKWVAEKLVTIARDRGIPVSIYRPGRISGHSQTGICNLEDHTFRTIKGCIQLGTAPNYDTLVNLTPVDYASKSIVYLSTQTSLGIFHIVNPQPLHWSKLINWIHSYGYPLKQIPEEQWRTELLNTASDAIDNALYPLIPIFTDTDSPNTKDTLEQTTIKKIDCQNTLNGLAKTSISCPPVDNKLLSTYFSYLTRSHFLNPPQPT